MSQNQDKGVTLIGMPGVGKTTVGPLVAHGLLMAFVDVDKKIIDMEKSDLQKIMDEKGEMYFLTLEDRLVRGLPLEGTVLSPGGSVVLNRRLMDYLKPRSVSVYMKDSFENVESRIPDWRGRGIVGSRSKTLRQIYDERAPLYEKYADITVDCANKSGLHVAKEIVKAYLKE